jgi:hypothetical protein
MLDASMYSADWDATRSAGLHLMHIVEFMEDERADILGEKRASKGKTTEELEQYRFGGFLFEHAMAWHIIEVECQRSPFLIRPGEWFWCYVCNVSLGPFDAKRARCEASGHSGIYATPDALRADTMRLKEWKFTWKSLRRAGGDGDTEYEHLREGIWRWPVQTMAYCHLLDLTGADQEVFFVNGDYTNRQPLAMRYEMEFTPRDLSENWDGIVSTAEREGWLVK